MLRAASTLLALSSLARSPEPAESGKLASPPALAREQYSEAKARLGAARAAMAREYQRARSERERAKVLDRAGAEVLRALTQELMPAWYGTDWTFSGTSTAPGQGSIACGMFVGTVLADAGFNLDRIALGRLASEHIALSLTAAPNLRRYSDRPPEEVVEELGRWGEGLYLVGLDYHAGLAWVDAEGRARFIHSTVLSPSKVVSEPLLGPNPFAASRYRVLARLLDRPMTRKWLLGQRFAAVAARPAAPRLKDARMAP